MTPKIATATQDDYAAIFEAERRREYPAVTMLEQQFGYAVNRDRLEQAARVLACPLKAHAPNWQHGRVLYAMVRQYLAGRSEPVTLMDIGTAKGFSALCLQWALDDAEALGAVVSVDVLDPNGTERRNSVLECDGPKTLAEFLAAWPEAVRIYCAQSTGVDWLERHPGRVHVAFVDGKHSGAVVWHEGQLLAARQHPGDLVLFDDVQIDGVDMAVRQLEQFYTVQIVHINDERKYAIGVRRG